MRLTLLLLVLFCAIPMLLYAQDDSEHGVQSRIIALEKA